MHHSYLLRVVSFKRFEFLQSLIKLVFIMIMNSKPALINYLFTKKRRDKVIKYIASCRMRKTEGDVTSFENNKKIQYGSGERLHIEFYGKLSKCICY